MADLIERQAAIDAVLTYRHSVLSAEEIIDTVPSAQPESSFVTWLLDEIWDEDMWELNWQAFPEVLCRKLTKLGYIKEKDGEYERLDKQTGDD